jgi:hypothetical protein
MSLSLTAAIDPPVSEVSLPMQSLLRPAALCGVADTEPAGLDRVASDFVWQAPEREGQ